MDRFYTPIKIDPLYLAKLKRLWRDVEIWLEDANGARIPWSNPIGRAIGRSEANKALNKYFGAIEQLIPKDQA